jgi:tRNA pseudouridine38-40 synthase
MAEKFNLVIQFAYNGTGFDGLERVKNNESTSVEEILFKAFPDDTVSLTHISRASLTSPGEHAARQVISLKYVGTKIPTVDEINAKLPASIKVFKIFQVEKEFSARRTCDARTTEYMIPVSFFFTTRPMHLPIPLKRLSTAILMKLK